MRAHAVWFFFPLSRVANYYFDSPHTSFRLVSEPAARRKTQRKNNEARCLILTCGSVYCTRAVLLSISVIMNVCAHTPRTHNLRYSDGRARGYKINTIYEYIIMCMLCISNALTLAHTHSHTRARSLRRTAARRALKYL